MFNLRHKSDIMNLGVDVEMAFLESVVNTRGDEQGLGVGVDEERYTIISRPDVTSI